MKETLKNVIEGKYKVQSECATRVVGWGVSKVCPPEELTFRQMSKKDEEATIRCGEGRNGACGEALRRKQLGVF